MRSTLLAAIAVLALLSLLPAAMAGAQSSPNSLLLGTITADGNPAPSLRTVITATTAGGTECGNTIPQGGVFSMLLSCPAGVAYVNVNGVPVAVIQVVPLGNVVVHLSIPAIGPPTPIPTGATPILPTAPTPRVPVSGNTAAPAQDGSGSMPLVAFGGLVVAAAFLMIAKVAASAGSAVRG